MRFSELSEVLAREIGEERAKEAASVICRFGAGETLYIPERPVPPAVTPRDTPRTLQARYGVSRQCAYQWLRKFRQRVTDL